MNCSHNGLSEAENLHAPAGGSSRCEQQFVEPFSMVTESQMSNNQRTRSRQSEYRNDPTGKVCDCGQVALKWHRGAFVCSRCLELEAQYDDLFIVVPFRPVRDVVPRNELVEEQPIQVGGSLAYLDMLLLKYAGVPITHHEASKELAAYES